MTEQSTSEAHAESQLSRLDAWLSSVDELIRRRPGQHEHDHYDHISPHVVHEIDHGMCAVPTYRIMLGSEQRVAFDRWLSPPSKLQVTAAAESPTLQVLLKVGEFYYERDGYHRGAVAWERGQMFLRAHVIEYVLDRPARPAEIVQLLVAKERDDFFARHRFPTDVPAAELISSRLGNYERLARHINHVRVRPEFGADASEQAYLGYWYTHYYLPVACVIRRRHMLSMLPGCGEIDLYLWAVERDGPWNNGELCPTCVRLARRNIVALWLALRAQQARHYHQ